MFNQGHFGTVQKGASGLAPQYEPFLLQISPLIIQEGNNTQEAQQGRNPPPYVA